MSKPKPQVKVGYYEKKGVYIKTIGGHKFYLGADQDKAVVKAAKIVELWKRCNAEVQAERKRYYEGLTGKFKLSEDEKAKQLTKQIKTWQPTYLEMAKAISNNKKRVLIDPHGGFRTKAAKRGAAEVLYHPYKELGETLDLDIQPTERLTERPSEIDIFQGATLKDVIENWQNTITDSSKRDKWKFRLLKDGDQLIKVHGDIKVSELSYDGIKSLGEYWLSLPPSNTRYAKKNSKCIAPDTAIAMIKRLRMVIDWLDATELQPFKEWRTPRRYADCLVYKRADLEKRYRDKTGDKPTNENGAVRSFSIDELKSMWAVATSREKLYICLGLNAGYTQNEIAHLTKSEIDLQTGYIQRDRTKTGVFAKHKLWAITIEIIKKELARTGSLAFRTNRGKPLVTVTSSGNNSDKIANRWYRLISRASTTTPIPQPNGFKYLRKTGAQLIRDILAVA